MPILSTGGAEGRDPWRESSAPTRVLMTSRTTTPASDCGRPAGFRRRKSGAGTFRGRKVVQFPGDSVPFLGRLRISEWIASSDPETHDPNLAFIAEVHLVPESFPTLGRALMTFLLIAGMILLALWLVETIVFLVGYRQSNSKSP